MSYKQKSKEWYDRALTEKDDFIKFMLLYASFTVLTNDQHRTIKSIKKDLSIKNDFFQTIPSTKLKEFYKMLNISPLINMKPRSNQRLSIRLHSEKDFVSIIDFLVQTRNNLFHGEKGLDMDRDKLIVRYGNVILEPLVRILLSK